jgi:hypothetical protein
MAAAMAGAGSKANLQANISSSGRKLKALISRQLAANQRIGGWRAGMSLAALTKRKRNQPLAAISGIVMSSAVSANRNSAIQWLSANGNNGVSLASMQPQYNG